MLPVQLCSSDLERMQAQLAKDRYPRWSALTWARTHLLQVLAPLVLEQLHLRARGVVREIAAGGLESLALRSVGTVSQSQAGHLYAEVRFESSVRFVGKVERQAAEAARSLRWSVNETPFNTRWKHVHQVLSLPVDLLVTFHPDGKFKEIELRNFAYGRGVLGRRG